MSRFFTLLFAMFIISMSVSAQVYHEYEIMRTQNGTVVYSDENGAWLTRESWAKKYGRKDFRNHFPDPDYYDHMVENGYIRTHFRKTFSNVVGGDMEWSRVLESNKPIELLRREAANKMNDVIYEDEESISGVIERKSFIPDHRGRYFLMASCVWRANVTYEFKSGRYKVTLSNIYYDSNISTSYSSYHTSSFLPHSANTSGFSISGSAAPTSLSTVLNGYDATVDENYWVDDYSHLLINFFDRNFTAAVILSTREVENDVNNDW